MPNFGCLISIPETHTYIISKVMLNVSSAWSPAEADPGYLAEKHSFHYQGNVPKHWHCRDQHFST